MKIVVFGLAVSSAWGNGHATVWRGLSKALGRRGHRVVFFERDVQYYASHRDLHELPGGELILYQDWDAIRATAQRHLDDSDVGMVTSYCPDGVSASELVLDSPAGLRVFYDLDAPITLDRLRSGQSVEYIGPRGLRDFDLVLSFTGGTSLAGLVEELGARRVEPLYGSVDPEVHRPALPVDDYRAELSYLGTYAADRNAALQALFIGPAKRLPDRRFVLGGSMYDGSFPWQPNIFFVAHVPPGLHPAFYCSSRLTLNVTRQAMAEMGYCPSARLFEAAACGAPLLSDWWDGLEHFFQPGSEILVAHDTDQAVAAIELGDSELRRIARAAQERTMAEHTADHRAKQLEDLWGRLQPARGLSLATEGT